MAAALRTFAREDDFAAEAITSYGHGRVGTISWKQLRRPGWWNLTFVAVLHAQLVDLRREVRSLLLLLLAFGLESRLGHHLAGHISIHIEQCAKLLPLHSLCRIDVRKAVDGAHGTPAPLGITRTIQRLLANLIVQLFSIVPILLPTLTLDRLKVEHGHAQRTLVWHAQMLLIL